ncbi:MAG: TetR/AcrR family transcriptional regulator [Dermatophilaceae bacterium]
MTSGRPRDTTVEPRVRKAVLEVLASKGYAGLRIEDVVRTSGVAKTSIYRRWSSLDALVLDAVDVALGDRTVPETGDVVADLMTLVTMLHRSLVDNPLGWALPAIGLSVARDPHLGPDYRARFVLPLRDQAVALISRGIAEGRFVTRLSPEVIVDAVAGSFVFRRVMDDEPPTLAEVRRLVAELTGVGAGDGSTGSARAVGYGSTPQSPSGPGAPLAEGESATRG